MFPPVSRARAVRTWVPLETVVVFQLAEKGPTVSSAPRLLPSRRNCTPATPTLSAAVALTEMVPKQLPRSSGWRYSPSVASCRPDDGAGFDRTGRRHFRPHPAAVNPVIIRAGRQPRIGIARGCRLGDPIGGAGSKSGSRRAIHIVVDDASIVSGGGPTQRRRADAAGRRQIASVPWVAAYLRTRPADAQTVRSRARRCC